MKRVLNILILGGILLLSTQLTMAADLHSFFTKADAFFNKYVNNGRVAYKDINSHFNDIKSLYETINTTDLSSATDAEKKAFYINAYNLIVIYQVSKYYPLKSALDQSGFFNQVKHTVAGEPMTLNYLEIKKLVLGYHDPRVHFVLACAAVSCPPLASFAYDPAQLDEQMEQRTRLALNDPEWLKVRADQKKVLLSKIFDWYQKDFTMNGAHSAIEFINKYRNSKIPADYGVGYYEYDWSLNESGGR